MTVATLNTTGTRPRVGVVLGSGGIKPMAAFSRFEFLEDAGIEVDLIAVGSSGGAVVVSMIGAGYKPAEARQIMLDMLFHGKLFDQTDHRSILGLAELASGRSRSNLRDCKTAPIKKWLPGRIFGDLRMEESCGPKPSCRQPTWKKLRA